MSNHEFGINEEIISFPDGNITDGILQEIDFDASLDTQCCLRAVGQININNNDPNAKMMLRINIDSTAIPDEAYLIGSGPYAIQGVFNILAGKHKAYLLGFNELPFELQGASLTAHLSNAP